MRLLTVKPASEIAVGDRLAFVWSSYLETFEVTSVEVFGGEVTVAYRGEEVSDQVAVPRSTTLIVAL